MSPKKLLKDDFLESSPATLGLIFFSSRAGMMEGMVTSANARCARRMKAWTADVLVVRLRRSRRDQPSCWVTVMRKSVGIYNSLWVESTDLPLPADVPGFVVLISLLSPGFSGSFHATLTRVDHHG